MTHQESLYGKTPDQLAALCGELGMPRFAARQIARWLYVRHTEDPPRMTDIAAAHRQRLAERFSPALSAPERVTESADGTKKYLFRTLEGHYVESAYIPDGERATLCVSSQAGCRMGCRFCATGRQGLQQSLTAAEILNQAVSLPERDKLTNLVFMGMGEPLDNTDEVLADARDNHRRVGFRLVADTHHALHGGRRARIAAFSRRDEGSPGRQPPQPLPRRAYGDHARRTGVADRRSRRDPARIRLHPPAAGVVRIHRDERAERLPRATSAN